MAYRFVKIDVIHNPSSFVVNKTVIENLDASSTVKSYACCGFNRLKKVIQNK
ncbi:MAG TPA: hypothetical protein VIK86_02960 [Candidatus Paceibacterota bacterium]